MMRPKRDTDDVIIGGNQLSVLQVIFRERDDAYAGGIYVQLERDGNHIHLPRIYTILGQLEKKGLVSFDFVKPPEHSVGRWRKVYKITAKGQEVLRRSLVENPVLGKGDGWVLPGLGGEFEL